jgi:hypothetical protein
MAVVVKKVFDEALSLPAETRVSLVEKLLISLNLPTQPEIDRLWSKEAERRISQIDKGVVRLVPGERVFRNIRKKYRRWSSTFTLMPKPNLIRLWSITNNSNQDSVSTLPKKFTPLFHVSSSIRMLGQHCPRIPVVV